MKTTRRAIALGAVALALLANAADARPLHRHRHRVAVRPVYNDAASGGAAPYGYGVGPFGNNPYAYGRRSPSVGQVYDGQIVEQAAVRAQSEPGVTSEIEPSARQTATGGPAGGVPNHSDSP